MRRRLIKLQEKKNKKIIDLFWAVVLMPSMLPENLMIFFSGIFLSIAINIATKDIPIKLDLPTNIFISMALMIVSSVVLAIWATITKPLQHEFKSAVIKGIKAWRDMICPYKDGKIITSKGWLLLVIEIIAILSMVLSFVFL
jgi:hypothetical protein